MVGVAVSRLSGEAVGFAIPPNVIASFLAGDVAGLTAEFLGVQNGSAQIGVNLRLIDPLGKLRGVVGTLRAAGKRPVASDSTRCLRRVAAACRRHQRALDHEAGAAGGQVAIPVATPDDRKLFAQFVLTDHQRRDDRPAAGPDL